MAPTPTLPVPLPGGFGQRLLPALVDEIAVSDPSRPIYSIARSADPADGFDDISFKVFARAINRCAWFLHETLGSGWDQETPFPTLAYLGPQDVMYGILTLAAIKTGYKMLYNSPRNTLEAHLSLFDKTDCNTFLMPPAFPLPVVKQILAAKPMKVVEVPGQRHWLADSETDDEERLYPYTKTYEEARLDPFATLHTSGSTGQPKPIVQTHGTVSIIDAHNALPLLGLTPAYPSIELCAGKRIYMTFPLFHTGGLFIILPGAIYSQFTVVLGPFPPSVETVNAVHVHGNINQSTLAPMTAVELVKNPEYLNNLSRLDYVSSGGGPLPKAVGDLITTKTTLFMGLGSTECGLFPVQIPKEPLDWDYMRVSRVLGQEYRPVSDDLYEQVIVRRPDLEPFQGVFATFPDLQEYPMKDLYSKHPEKDDIWLYRGRTDDVIVYSTGEKLNPLEMEGIIGAHPAVSAALITGLGRFQSALLVEATNPPATDSEKEDLIDTIWPSIEAANKASPGFGRIHRNMIAFTTSDRPMLRAGKGTVQRRLTTDIYADELNGLYKGSEKAKIPNLSSGLSVEGFVRGVISNSTELDGNGLNASIDLFELGLDSLQVTVIVKHINGYLLNLGSGNSIDARAVYSSHTIEKLTNTVASLLQHQTAPAEATLTTTQRLEEILTHLSIDLPVSSRPSNPRPSDGKVVLFTGSTGSMGSYILDSLSKSSGVSRVYCLNRGPDSKGRQQDSLTAKGLQLHSLEKIVFLDADITKTYFGLSSQDYKRLLDEVTDVIHNAWQVDFNLSIESFSRHVAVVRRFIDFSSHSAFGAHLFFISSVSAVGGLLNEGQSVPETLAADIDWSTPEPMGYGQSKFIAERLLHTAAKEAGIPATICRVGQVAGPTTQAGVWPQKEWFPSLISSSKTIGKLPSSLGRMNTIDWIPVDILGEAIVELLTVSSSKPAGHDATVYNLVNPQRTTWTELAPIVAQVLRNDEDNTEVVSFEAWVEALRQSASAAEAKDLEKNPALKIFTFFESLVDTSRAMGSLSTEQAISSSNTLAKVQPVGQEWVKNWLRQWGYSRT